MFTRRKGVSRRTEREKTASGRGQGGPPGQGSPGVVPPLAKSDFLMGEKKWIILALVQGLSGSIVVNGKSYDGSMPPVVLDDQKAADVLTYVRNSFGNSGEGVSADEVKSVRSGSRF